MYWLSWYLEASTSWNSQRLSRAVMGLLFLYTCGCRLMLEILEESVHQVCTLFSKNVGPRRKFYTEDPQILGAIVRNSVTWMTWCPGFVPLCHTWCLFALIFPWTRSEQIRICNCICSRCIVLPVYTMSPYSAAHRLSPYYIQQAPSLLDLWRMVSWCMLDPFNWKGMDQQRSELLKQKPLSLYP